MSTQISFYMIAKKMRILTKKKTKQATMIDLNHVCRAFNEHMGVYVLCQAHQLRFPPQEHMSETYDVCASYMYLYS
jgi:hypothetical protein